MQLDGKLNMHAYVCVCVGNMTNVHGAALISGDSMVQLSDQSEQSMENQLATNQLNCLVCCMCVSLRHAK